MTILQSIILNKDVNHDARLEAVATLKNISFYADDFRLLILQHPGLLEAIIHNCSENEDDLGREYTSAVLRNLAMAPDTKIPMAEHSCLLDVFGSFD